MSIYRVEQKNLAKFSDTGSAKARGLYIGSPRLVGGRKAGNLNMQKNLRHAVHMLALPQFLQSCKFDQHSEAQ